MNESCFLPESNKHDISITGHNMIVTECNLLQNYFMYPRTTITITSQTIDTNVCCEKGLYGEPQQLPSNNRSGNFDAIGLKSRWQNVIKMAE